MAWCSRMQSNVYPLFGPDQTGARVVAGIGVVSTTQGKGTSPGGWERLQGTTAGQKACASMARRRGVEVASAISVWTASMVTPSTLTAVPASAFVSTMMSSTE